MIGDMAQLILMVSLLLLQAKPIRELTLPLRLQWKRCKDMPYERFDSHAVVIRRRVYVGGGYGNEATVVMVYDPHSDQWSQLPPYQFKKFGMAAVNDQLVLVGGEDDSFKRTNRLGVWDEKSHQWTEPYPPRKTACFNPSVVTYEKWLVVAGGYDGHALQDRVEILDTTTRQWYSAAPLPRRCTRMKSALVGDTLYLMGGYDGGAIKEVFTVSLPALIRQATTPSEAASPATAQTLWQTLPPTPLKYSAALTLRGSLLAIGGRDDKRKRSSAIHLYQPHSIRKCVKVGDLPSARDSHVCTLLPSGEFLVLGGIDGHYGTRTSQVDMATVQ